MSSVVHFGDVIRNILFDWSGTLVDDLPAVWKASNHVFRQAQVQELTLEQFRAEFCLPFKNFYDRYIPHVELAQLETWYHAHMRELPDQIVALPHAREFLEFCRERGIRMFLFSSVHRDHFSIQARQSGLGEFFERVYVQVWDKREAIPRLLEENRLNPAETLFVGDMQHDVEAARAGSVFSCGVLTGYNKLHQLRASEPDVIVEHLGELKQFLLERNFEMRAPESAGLRPIATVGALIEDAEGRFLMIRTHKWSDLWGIPGGKIKGGETSEEALRREVLEETALELEEVRFVMVQDCIRSTEFYREAHFLLLNYHARVAGVPAVKLNHEAQEFRWVSAEEAASLPLNTPTRVLLEKVLQEERA